MIIWNLIVGLIVFTTVIIIALAPYQPGTKYAVSRPTSIIT